MDLKLLVPSFAAIFLLSGCARYDDAQHVTSAVAAPIAVSAATTTYVQTAASAGLFEVQAGQLAMQRSSNPQIRSLAQQLVSDHSRLASQLSYAAQSAGTTVPNGMLLPQHSAVIANLQAAPPQDFDASYRAAIINSQMQELDSHQRYAATTDQAPLRDFAQAAISTAQMRLNQAQSLVIAPPSYYRAPSHRRAGERG
jgi:putative membrane protein